MRTKLLTPKKRKIIDIPEDTFRTLNIRAAAAGESLKSFIEKLLVMEANSLSDEEMYSLLLQTDPEGEVEATDKEESDFRNWLKE